MMRRGVGDSGRRSWHRPVLTFGVCGEVQRDHAVRWASWIVAGDVELRSREGNHVLRDYARVELREHKYTSYDSCDFTLELDLNRPAEMFHYLSSSVYTSVDVIKNWRGNLWERISAEIGLDRVDKRTWSLRGTIKGKKITNEIQGECDYVNYYSIR